MKYNIPNLPLQFDLETKAVLKQVNAANKKLAELKGVSNIVPNPAILIRTLSLQEAKDSSAIESVITTHDDLYKAEVVATKFISPATKEVSTYADALMKVWQLVLKKGFISNNYIIEIYRAIKNNDAGYSTNPGKCLKKEGTNEVVYTPPLIMEDIVAHMDNLEKFINYDELSDLDPLIKMAIIHHQFESIHPFGDGNGRTGRVLNILYLVSKGLLELPILYLSRYIIKNKDTYYKLIQAIRDKNTDNAREWEEWVLFILKGVEITAEETTAFIKGISRLMLEYKHQIRNQFPGIYSQDLINNLFYHPYTKIEFVVEELNVTRPTAMSYLNKLVEAGFLEKIKLGRENFYINIKLFELIVNAFH